MTLSIPKGERNREYKAYLKEVFENVYSTGKNIKELAEDLSRPPEEIFLELLDGEDAPICVFMSQKEDIVREIMKKDWIITASDGWTQSFGISKPHPRAYGTFPEKLRKFVLDEKIITLPEALKSMTALPSDKFKIKKRGRIATGFYADIAVIDMEKISSNSTIKNPHKYASGIEYLFVNGVLSIEKGAFTGAVGGCPIRFNNQ